MWATIESITFDVILDQIRIPTIATSYAADAVDFVECILANLIDVNSPFVIVGDIAIVFTRIFEMSCACEKIGGKCLGDLSF